jgi:hypothetical protein
MSAITWKEGVSITSPNVGEPAVVVRLGPADEPTTASLVGVASPKTTYRIHDNENGTFLAIVLEKRGMGTLNNQVEDNLKDIVTAQAACQKDWDAGKRT